MLGFHVNQCLPSGDLIPNKGAKFPGYHIYVLVKMFLQAKVLFMFLLLLDHTPDLQCGSQDLMLCCTVK